MIGALLLLISTVQAYDEPESCKILWVGPSEEWRFVKVYEQATGEIVFQSVVKGGESRGVYVKTPRIRVELKWAGDKDYRAGPIVDCKDGNTVRI